VTVVLELEGSQKLGIVITTKSAHNLLSIA